jgi:hypothetical protein
MQLVIISDDGLLRSEGITYTVIITSDGGLLRSDCFCICNLCINLYHRILDYENKDTYFILNMV